MSASLALQKAIRSTLAGDPAVTALVPASSIFDRHSRPETFPCVVLGEDQELPADRVVQRFSRVHSTIHVWTRELGTTDAKAIAGALRSALNMKRPALDGGKVLDLRFTGSRFMRDPDGESAHAVVTFETVIEGAL